MADTIEIIQGTATTVEVAGPTGPQGPAGAAGASQADVLTVQGDILYRGASAAARLGIGSSGQVLKVSGGIPAWANESGAVSSVAGKTGVVTLDKNDVGLSNVANTAQVTSVTGTAPISSSGGTTPAISISAATTSAAGSMSSADKTKLDGIATGAEVNVQANWTEANSASDAFIQNKPTLGTASTKDAPATGNASSTQVVLGNDTRLSDSRSPSTHASSHAAAGSDPVYNQNLNTSNEPSFAGLTINGTAVAGQTPDTVLRGGAWFGGASGDNGVGIYKETSYGGNAVSLSGVNQAVSQYNNIILASSATPQLCLATNANVGIGSTAPAEKLDVGGNLVLRDADNESQAEFDDTIAGTTGNTVIRALYFGTIGNSVVLNFDGLTTINEAIATWNEDNASNTIALFDGSGTQVPSNGASVSLTGGVSRRATFSVSGLSAGRSYTLPNASGSLALTSDISGGVTDGDKGDITVSGSGATWAINANAVTNADLAQVATSTLKGRATAATGNVEDLTASQARTILNVADGATANSSDATLLARANHTGTQAHTTITGLGGAATLNVGATTGTVAAGDDSRFHTRSHAMTGTSDHTASNWSVFYSNGSGQVTELGLGANGTILTSAGATSAPTFSAPASGGTKTYATFNAEHNQPPASAFATLDTRNSIAVLDFDAATDENAVFVGIMPEAASLGSGLIVRLHWMATSATSGNVRWGVQFERSNTDLDADSFDTAVESTAAANGTSGILTTTAITVTTIDGITAGDVFRLKVYRNADDATNDTMTGDAELVAVEVRSAA